MKKVHVKCLFCFKLISVDKDLAKKHYIVCSDICKEGLIHRNRHNLLCVNEVIMVISSQKIGQPITSRFEILDIR